MTRSKFCYTKNIEQKKNSSLTLVVFFVIVFFSAGSAERTGFDACSGSRHDRRCGGYCGREERGKSPEWFRRMCRLQKGCSACVMIIERAVFWNWIYSSDGLGMSMSPGFFYLFFFFNVWKRGRGKGTLGSIELLKSERSTQLAIFCAFESSWGGNCCENLGGFRRRV